MNLMGQVTPNGNDGTYHSMHKLLNSDSRNSPLDNAEKKILTDTSEMLSYQLMQKKNVVHLTISKMVFRTEPVFIFQYSVRMKY